MAARLSSSSRAARKSFVFGLFGLTANGLIGSILADTAGAVLVLLVVRLNWHDIRREGADNS